MQIATDWDSYYEKPYKTASVTRKITTSVLLKLIRRFCKKQSLDIVEIGGANSCFFDAFYQDQQPSSYTVVDNNTKGLQKFEERIGDLEGVSAVYDDILAPQQSNKGNLVFSVGLVEHFDKEGTRKAILNHFEYADSDAVIIISVPTPTLLYRITRKIAEVLGLWIFHDERPLEISEVQEVLESHGKILEQTIIWPIFLTQAVFVVEPKK